MTERQHTRSMLRSLFSGLWIVSFVTFLLRSAPPAISESIISGVIKFVLAFSPRYRNVGLRNLEIAFPDIPPPARLEMYRSSLRSLARVLVDFARLPKLDPQWVSKHVECKFLPRYLEIKQQHPNLGVLLATGHLGSFELLAHCMPMWGHPIAFVVRNFKWQALDDWWRESRERFGNKVISRKGAFKEVFRRLQDGNDVALLFDQNVTVNHAAFVPWFGKDAATTRTLALAALRAECPVLVAGIIALPDDRYEVVAEECDFWDLYRDSSRSFEEKVEIITRDVSSRYEGFIRRQPERWFWLHRRWRTRPSHDPRNPYEGC